MRRSVFLNSMLFLAGGVMGWGVIFLMSQLFAAYQTTPKPVGQLIYNHLEEDFTPLRLFWADIGYRQVMTYTLDKTGLKAEEKNFVPYTEGFVSENNYSRYVAAIEATTQTSLAKGFHHIAELEDFVVLAPVGTLQDLFIFDPKSERVYPVAFSDTEPLYTLYISHVRQVGNQLIILAGQANAYYSIVYAIDLPSYPLAEDAVFTLNRSLRFATHATALNQKHYTLTNNGTSLLLYGTQLQRVLPETFGVDYLTPDFTPTELTHTMDDEVALLTTQQTPWQVQYYTLTGKLSESHLLMPPVTTSISVKILGDSRWLYSLVYDPQGEMYTHYLTLYDKKTGEMAYCYGFYNQQPLTLLDMTFIS